MLLSTRPKESIGGCRVTLKRALSAARLAPMVGKQRAWLTDQAPDRAVRTASCQHELAHLHLDHLDTPLPQDPHRPWIAGDHDDLARLQSKDVTSGILVLLLLDLHELDPLAVQIIQ